MIESERYDRQAVGYGALRGYAHDMSGVVEPTEIQPAAPVAFASLIIGALLFWLTLGTSLVVGSVILEAMMLAFGLGIAGAVCAAIAASIIQWCCHNLR